MAEKIKNIPSPDILMNSLRSIGYSFKTAVADIIDNSISADAKNIWIDFPSYSSDNLYITILDDAIGMDDAALFNAMKYGSERDEYGEKDLGRFGVGLKSASLSQCRTLTVMSKFNGDIHAYRWDLEAQIDGTTYDDYFLTDTLGKLVAMGELIDPQPLCVNKKGRNNRIMSFDALAFDESDKSVVLISNEFKYDKRSDNGVTDSGRKIMGRKGIGKLATFSLTNTVRVLSSKDHKKAGCILDFKRITEDDAEPDAINPDVIIFDEKRLSKNGTGTRLELIGVKKKITVSFRFIVSKLMRTFDVNDLNFSIHIRKNNEKYRTLIRSELDYFSIMDTIITIGENFASKLESVNNNSIPERYKLTSTYDEYIAAQPVRGRNLLSAFPYKIEVEDKDGNAANIDFAISGWMGTVRNLPDLRLLEKETDDAEDEDRITINDNRISLYSRGKLGEYDILSKIKNNRNSEAYVIGELYVDIFEQDGLADMAISNRRGYEENDPRYIEVIKIAKRLLGYIVGQKDIVSKRRKEDDQRIEDEKIKKKFWENPQTREILELRLNDAEKQVVQEENLQFTRAVNNGKQTKKIFISHKEEHKLYGQFIVDVLETYGVDVVSTIIFTGDRRLGVPQGKDIYDYLKDCFREDLMVIFLFSKAFYDSNICISEAGAAWATNQNCMNVVIDISFSDIEKPSNNALSSIKFQQIRTPDQTITVTEFFKTIIEEGLHFEYDESKLQKALNYVLKTDKYSDQKIDFPATFLPKRKFLPVPRCPKCHNIMLLTEENGRLKYVCSNVSCDECYEAVIN